MFQAALLLIFIASSRFAVVLEEGDLLVTDSATGVLVRVNPDTLVETVVSSGFEPRAVVVTSGRRIFVNDAASRIVEVDAATGAQTDISKVVAFEAPSYLVLDPAGQLYVIDTTLGAVLRLDPVTHLHRSRFFGWAAPAATARDRPRGRGRSARCRPAGHGSHSNRPHYRSPITRDTSDS